MATNFGFTKQNNVTEKITDIETKISDNEKKIILQESRRKQNKAAIVALTTFVATTETYKTVFDINVSTASRDMPNLPLLDLRSIQENGSIMTQTKTWNYPDVELDNIKNDSYNYMHFPCPELMFTNVSVFIVLEALTTVNSGEWCYIFGNDNGSYDKFLGYKSNSLTKLNWGGTYPAKKNECTLPSGFNIKKKHLLSIHWLMINSCLYANGTKISGSDFTTNFKSSGEPYGTIFYNDRMPSGSSSAQTVFTGKIYGMKIITGSMIPADIVKESQKLITEYNIVV